MNEAGRAYLEARAEAIHAQTNEAMEAAVCNHLYAFFSPAFFGQMGG